MRAIALAAMVLAASPAMSHSWYPWECCSDQDGNAIETGRRTIALCRCGRSQIRPFCDGTHKLIGFKAPGGAEAPRRAAG